VDSPQRGRGNTTRTCTGLRHKSFHSPRIDLWCTCYVPGLVAGADDLHRSRQPPAPGTDEVHAKYIVEAEMSAVPHSSNHVIIRPPHRLQPHRAARPATSWSPRPPSASRPAGRSSGVPGPARSVTSTRTTPSPAMTATVTVSPGAPEPLCRTLLPKISLTSKTATSPHGCPGPSTSPTNLRAARARSARPASVTLSRTAAPAITAPALPRPDPPRETGRAAGGRREMHARLRYARQVGTRPPRTLSVARPSSRPPSVAVRSKPTVPHTAPWPRFSSAMRSWTPQCNGLQRDKVTHAGTEQKRPA
jgi:hypothetical protein